MIYRLLSKKLLFLLLPITLFGQIKEDDLTRLPYEELKKLFFDNQNNTSQQLKYADAFLNKAKKEKDNRQIARGYYWFSLMHKENKAISYLDSVIKYSTGTKDLNFPITAYCEKANILTQQSKHQQALDNFLLAEKYAIKNNRTDDYYAVLFYIALTKSENLGEVNEALDKYRICYRYIKGKDTRLPQYSYFSNKVLFAMADAHKSLHQTDSATYYNKLGYDEAKRTGYEDFIYLFVLNEGANLVIKKKYKLALDSVNKAFPQIIKSNDQPNIMASYYYLGKAYDGLKSKDAAAHNFIKVDSMYKITKEMYPELTSTYPFLIDYYKNKGNKDKQLEYLTKYMRIDDSLQKSHNKMYKLLVKEYDIPHLVKDKEDLIQLLKGDKVFYYWGIAGILTIAIGLGSYSFYQRDLNKKYKARFEKIIANSETVADYSELIIKKDSIEKLEIVDNDKLKDLDILPEKIQELLQKLNIFEKNKGYLKPNVGIQMLSDEFKTNSKYLSQIVNFYKKKSFVNYVNDLRIDDAVLSLQGDNDLKKYTIQHIATKFGFNNAEAFSIAFHKRTGIKPSFFIKELEKKQLL